MPQKSTGGTPRWVKVMGVVVIVLILLVVVALVTDLGGPHGPSRHVPSGDARVRYLAARVTEVVAPFVPSAVPGGRVWP